MGLIFVDSFKSQPINLKSNFTMGKNWYVPRAQRADPNFFDGVQRSPRTPSSRTDSRSGRAAAKSPFVPAHSAPYKKGGKKKFGNNKVAAAKISDEEYARIRAEGEREAALRPRSERTSIRSVISAASQQYEAARGCPIVQSVLVRISTCSSGTRWADDDDAEEFDFDL